MKQKIYTSKRLVLRPLRITDFGRWLESQEAFGPRRDKFDVDPLAPRKRTKARFRDRVLRNRRQAAQDEAYILSILQRLSFTAQGIEDRFQDSIFESLLREMRQICGKL